ncbi:DUF1364 domain-containing protein [Pseudomonas sp. GD03842]|uniref:DUF1364 domain-containing protein n=1 Tax=Pseudomonas sp. GD03842 TaxID=2975385 RepID=UPI00244B3445|nr:DUF1364 domain-containing protein [Pseudomonas sp. GD03842]MDH0745268.1 DUF1364 domain-containing protein [Pseudomonas sp. GD03842]
MRQTKLTKAARGRDCQIRVPGVCNGNPETTVLAHFRLAGTRSGMGIKPNDLQGAWACSACHDAVDARSKTEFRHDELRVMHMEGIVRTLDILVAEGKVAA